MNNFASSSLSLSFLSLITVGALSACGSSEPAATAPAPSETAAPAGNSTAATDDVVQVCTQMLTRQRECQDVFLPGLVAMRVRLDVPAGIAATDASEGREALLARAQEEYVVDSTDESIAANCDDIATKFSAEQLEEMEPAVTDCMAQTECNAFSTCSLALMEATMTK